MKIENIKKMKKELSDIIKFYPGDDLRKQLIIILDKWNKIDPVGNKWYSKIEAWIDEQLDQAPKMGKVNQNEKEILSDILEANYFQGHGEANLYNHAVLFISLDESRWDHLLKEVRYLHTLETILNGSKFRVPPNFQPKRRKKFQEIVKKHIAHMSKSFPSEIHQLVYYGVQLTDRVPLQQAVKLYRTLLNEYEDYLGELDTTLYKKLNDKTYAEKQEIINENLADYPIREYMWQWVLFVDNIRRNYFKQKDIATFNYDYPLGHHTRTEQLQNVYHVFVDWLHIQLYKKSAPHRVSRFDDYVFNLYLRGTGIKFGDIAGFQLPNIPVYGEFMTLSKQYGGVDHWIGEMDQNNADNLSNLLDRLYGDTIKWTVHRFEDTEYVAIFYGQSLVALGEALAQ